MFNIYIFTKVIIITSSEILGSVNTILSGPSRGYIVEILLSLLYTPAADEVTAVVVVRGM